MIKFAVSLALGVLLAPTPVIAQTSGACDCTINAVAPEISNCLGVALAGIGEKGVNRDYDNPHANRKTHLIFTVEFAEKDRYRSENFIQASQLQASYAKRITDACSDLAQVSFGIERTDIQVFLFRMTKWFSENRKLFT